MKLAKVRRGLMLLMSISLMSPMVFASEETVSKTVATATTAASVVEEKSSETLVVEEGENIDYEALEQAKIQRIKAQGTALGISKTMGNIKVTAEYIWADQYTYKLLLAVEHVDQTPFLEEVYSTFNFGNDLMSKSEYEKQKLWEQMPENVTIEEEVKALAKIDEAFKPFINKDGTVDEEGYMAFLYGGTEEEDMVGEFISGSASSSFGEYKVENAPSYKKYFLKEGSVNEPIEGEMVLSLGEYLEEKDVEYTSAMDLVAYLNEHKNDALKTQPLEIDEYEAEHLAALKDEDEAYYKEYMQQLAECPKVLLTEGGLKLNLVAEMPHFWIDNIGFVDGQLHMRLMGDTQDESYSIAFMNKQGEFAETTYGIGQSESDENGKAKCMSYRAYKIKDIEDLKQYTMCLSGIVAEVKTEDSFDFEIQMAPKAAKTIQVDQTVTLSETEKPVLKSVDLTDLSVVLKFDEFKREMEDDFPITLIMKDGKRIVQEYSDATKIGKDTATIIYQLSDEVTEIDKISVGGVEISVN